IGTVFGVKDTYRGRSGQREVVIKTLKNIPVFKEFHHGTERRKYLKNHINTLIKGLANYGSEFPIDFVFNYEGKTEKITFENFVFIHEFKSTTLQRSFINKTNVIPLNTRLVNGFLGNYLSKSVFEKYNLLENEKKYSKLTTHIPRHNINTFLALSGLAEHLQAMLMGRVDIKQNQHYQHLALKQRKVAASILEKYELTLYEKVEELKPEYPIDAIKKDGLMYFSDQLDLENNLKMNLQSFDSKNEVASYIKDSFFDEYFEDIAESFNELVKEDQFLANSLIQRHACLHPLPFGGCMREVAVHDCPKRLACQSGDQCGNFTLTGRKGELETLKLVLNRLLLQFESIEQLVAHDSTYDEMLEDLRQKILYLTGLKEKTLTRQNNLTP